VHVHTAHVPNFLFAAFFDICVFSTYTLIEEANNGTGKKAMQHFDRNQRDIIDQIRKTGRCNNSQIAVLLPSLVNYILKIDTDMGEKLALRYGQDLGSMLEGLGTELLNGRQDALSMFELMVSKTHKDN
jgi:hypothetical protein